MKGKNFKQIRSLVENEGLICVGFANLDPEPRFEVFEKWLAERKHGGMTYLENYKDIRKNPESILPGAKQAIVIGLPYYQGDRHSFAKQMHPRIAQYARFSDYHKVLKKKCERILESVLLLAPEGHSGKVLVDSSPILERALAERTMEGFVGKNTMFIHPDWGSYLLLSEIFVTFSLSSDSIEPSATAQGDGCGTCLRCQVYCPTGALTPYSLDATKCIAYYTIEHRGVIPVKYWSFLKTYIFGCDICQLVCPFNRGVEAVTNLVMKVSDCPPLFEMATMNPSYYEKTFGGTPMTRAKRSGLRRNALIAMVVMEDKKLEDAILQIQDEGDPLLMQTLEQIPEYKSFSHA